MMYEIFTPINDLVIMSKYKKDGRQYYHLSCSYGHTVDVRCDSLKENRVCSSCKKDSLKKKALPTVREGFIKGQLKVLERLPHAAYEKPKVKVLCTCGNLVEMFSCNIINKTQSFSCGNCQPYYKIQENTLYVFFGEKANHNVFVVDAEDSHKILNTSWTIHRDGNNSYVRLSLGDRNFLHRILTGCPEDMFVDHINGNGLDNRKANLRIVSKAENAKNRKLGIKNSSGKLGVAFNVDSGKWVAKIGVDNRRLHLGTFETKEDAILARELAEERYNFHENHGRLCKGTLGEDL